MSFTDAIRTCLTKYADFNGRAGRPEFWWFVLFTTLVAMGFGVIDTALFRNDTSVLGTLWGLAVLLPSLAVGARRLHDTGKSGWLQLLLLIPCVGLIVLIVFWATPSTTPPAIEGGPTPPAVEA